MKKKLFAVAIVVSVYVLFLLAFTAADEQGKISQVLNDIGLSEASAATQLGLANADVILKPSLKTPCPKPKRPKGPKSPRPKGR